MLTSREEHRDCQDRKRETMNAISQGGGQERERQRERVNATYRRNTEVVKRERERQ